MPEAITIVKSLVTFPVIPGAFMTLMALGVVPIDEGIASVAAPFIVPFGIPIKAFLMVLGPSKILGGLSLWGKGPMPNMFAKLGLVFASACAAYGHHVIGESVVPPIMYIGMMASLVALERSSKGKKE
jgi:hypothetical protein